MEWGYTVQNGHNMPYILVSDKIKCPASQKYTFALDNLSFVSYKLGERVPNLLFNLQSLQPEIASIVV